MILDCSAPGQYQVLVDEIHDFSAPISELRLPLKHTSPIFTLSLKDEQYIKGKSMSLQTNLKGRLRNTFLPKNHGLMPVFEAVVNSIQSIEEKGDIDSGKIVLSIDRATQGGLDLESRSIPPIIGFSISDNGCGFDNNNFKSFETLDSDHKIQKGCRGVGRLLWLLILQRRHSIIVVTAITHSIYSIQSFIIKRLMLLQRISHAPSCTTPVIQRG